MRFSNGIYRGSGYLIYASEELKIGIVLTCAHNFVKVDSTRKKCLNCAQRLYLFIDLLKQIHNHNFLS